MGLMSSQNHERNGWEKDSAHHCSQAPISIAYFKNRDINCKIFFDDATLQQAKKKKAVSGQYGGVTIPTG